ncbi:MAG: S-layer homology domain-containing protein, partial [Oscillospiraceae bacterium]|nr:S-layer homology domain-containing protein [Oscillospiraceae bacterium]
SHGQKFDVIITNNFIEYEGLFIINKEVIGQEPDLAHWGVDEDTLFYVGVQAVDSEEFLYFIQLSEDSNIFVYENAVGMEIPDGEPQFVIPISESTPAILVGLTTLYSNYAVIEFDDADGNELRYPSEIGFAAIIDGPTLDDGNLYATVLNIFMPGNYVIIDEGTLTISKLLDGDYEIFGIDETSEFFVGVMRDDSEDLLSFVYLADNVYVYVGSVNTKVPVGEPQIQISIFPGTDVVFLGLNIDYYDYLVFELEPDGTIIDTISEDGFFHSFVDGPDRDGDDLFVTITNTFFWVDGTGFRVFYHANGGDGDVPLDDAIYLEGDLVLVLSPDSLYRDGHTFIGWNTEPGGSGVWYLTGFVPFETEDEDSGTEAPVDDPSEAESPETEDEDSGADEPDDDNAFEMTYESLAPYALIGAPYALIDDGSFEMPGRHVTLYAQWQPVNGGSGNGSGGDNHTPPPPENYIPRVPPPIPRPAPGEFFIPQHIWYVRGDDNINMRPDANVTRAEVAMVFYRLLRPEWKLFEPDGTPFSDVAGDEWYGRAIGILANFGIVEGYDDGTFRPNAPISRKEFAAVVSRFDNLANTDNNPYTDLDPNDWAYRYILSATQKGWFIGYRDMFRPDAHLTRAEMVTAINRIFDRITLLEDVPDNVFRFLDLDESHWAYADFMEAAHTHTYQRRDINNTEVWIEIIETGLDAPYNR